MFVAEVGVGTVAAGVAKANSDPVLVAGHDGGTGASPVSSFPAASMAAMSLFDPMTIPTRGASTSSSSNSACTSGSVIARVAAASSFIA